MPEKKLDHPPRCPVPGCKAMRFTNNAIPNENYQYGGSDIEVIQCEFGHIIAPSNYEVVKLLRDINEKLEHLNAV